MSIPVLFNVAVAGIDGSSIVSVGNFVQLPEIIISSICPSAICIPQACIVAHVSEKVIIGLEIYPDHLLVIFTITSPVVIFAVAVTFFPVPVGAPMVIVGIPVQFHVPLSVMDVTLPPSTTGVHCIVAGHAALSTTFGGVEAYAEPCSVIFIVKDFPIYSVLAVAFDIGGAIVILVGNVSQFALESRVTPLKVISFNTHFSITVVALSP